MIRRWVNGSASSAASSAAATTAAPGAAHATAVGVRTRGSAAIAIGGDAATAAAGIDALRRLGNHGATATTAPARGDRRRPLLPGWCRAGCDAAALRAAIGLGANLPAITGTGGDALTGAGFRVARLRRCPLL
jgi:hypothetical protein